MQFVENSAFLKMWHFFYFLSYFIDFFFQFLSSSFSNCLIQIFSGRFDTSGSMIPRLVPEISPLDTFCEVVVVARVVVGIGDSRSWIEV